MEGEVIRSHTALHCIAHPSPIHLLCARHVLFCLLIGAQEVPGKVRKPMFFSGVPGHQMHLQKVHRSPPNPSSPGLLARFSCLFSLHIVPNFSAPPLPPPILISHMYVGTLRFFLLWESRDKRTSYPSWSSSTVWWRRWTATLATCANWTSCSTWRGPTLSWTKWCRMVCYLAQFPRMFDSSLWQLICRRYGCELSPIFLFRSGEIVETNKKNILRPIVQLDEVAGEGPAK